MLDSTSFVLGRKNAAVAGTSLSSLHMLRQEHDTNDEYDALRVSCYLLWLLALKESISSVFFWKIDPDVLQ